MQRRTIRWSWWRRTAPLAALALTFAATPAHATTQLGSTPLSSVAFNGPVESMARNASTIWVGGDFSLEGTRSGPAAAFTSAAGGVAGALPQVAGGRAQVSAVAADGHGGWYIGGDFTRVGTTARHDLAHIRADGSVDPAFTGEADHPVFALALAPGAGTLYAGGAFTTIGGAARRDLAALTPATGHAVAGFAPVLNGPVLALALDSTSVYAGGSFTAVGGHAIPRLARMSAATGAPVTTWVPAPDGTVNALARPADGTRLYAGGEFATIGGLSRPHLAALSPGNGHVIGAFAPDPDEGVSALAADGSHVYAGGRFIEIGGGLQFFLAALDPATGDLVPSFTTDADGPVFSLHLAGTRLYVGGDFAQLGGVSAPHLGALNGSTGAVQMAFAPGVGSSVAAIDTSPDGTHVYAGGAFTLVAGKPAPFLAALHATDGTPVAGYTSAATAPVLALALAPNGSRLYAGGDAGVIPTNPATGAAVAGFTADFDGPVNALVVSHDNGTVYAGGGFTDVGATSSPGVAALHYSTGTPNSGFHSPLTGEVRALALSADGHSLYAGGADTAHHLARMDTATGALAGGFAPAVDGTVDALALSPSGTTLDVGGVFAHAGGRLRHDLAELRADTGAATGAFAGGANAPVLAFAPTPDGSAVYAGGTFSAIAGQPIFGLAELDTAHGVALSTFDPEPDDAVFALAVGPGAGELDAGGLFRTFPGETQSGLARFGPGPPVVRVVPPPPARRPARPSILLVRAPRATIGRGHVHLDTGAQLACPAAGPACAGTLTARIGGHVAGQVALDAAPGAREALALDLSSAGAKLVDPTGRTEIDVEAVAHAGTSRDVDRTLQLQVDQPKPPRPGLVRLGSPRERVRHGRLRLDTGLALACRAAGPACTARLSAQATTRVRRHHRTRRVRVKLGSLTLRVAAGHRARLVLTLTSPGARLLRGHTRTKLGAVLTAHAGTATLHRRLSLTARTPKKLRR